MTIIPFPRQAAAPPTNAYNVLTPQRKGRRPVSVTSRTTYELIAKTFKDDVLPYVHDGDHRSHVKSVALSLCDAFGKDNPNFIPHQFMHACGFTEE